MAKVKATFFLPLRDNDGRDLRPEIRGAEVELYSAFVGFTRMGVVTGAYVMTDGTRSDDELMSYFLMLDEERIPELREVLTRFKGKTTQEAIYFELQYNTVIDFI
jgi:hypothetical protein